MILPTTKIKPVNKHMALAIQMGGFGLPKESRAER
jgi:hypothetical protein